jgi:hypothetical protein
LAFQVNSQTTAAPQKPVPNPHFGSHKPAKILSKEKSKKTEEVPGHPPRPSYDSYKNYYYLIIRNNISIMIARICPNTNNKLIVERSMKKSTRKEEEKEGDKEKEHEMRARETAAVNITINKCFCPVKTARLPLSRLHIVL